MKIDVQYVSDMNGKTQAVQLPVSDWNKLLNRIKKYEQSLKLKSNLREALEQVAQLKNTTTKKQTLTEFLDEL